MTRLGIMIEGQEGLNWERWNRLIEAADTLGFDSLWRSDHLFSVMGESQRETLSLWPSLTAVGLRSARLEFGQLVSPTTYRNPVHLAMDAVALDRLSGGRFWLGVGAGWNEREHAAFGFELWPLKERMDRFEEALQVITRLWSGDAVSFEGRHFHLDGAQTGLAPTRTTGVPIMIGGSGERRTLRLVAEYASEWNCTTIGHEAYEAKVAVLERHCRDVGRDPSTIQRSLMLGHIVGASEDELRRRAAAVQSVVPGLREQPVDEIIERQRGRGWLVGTPDELVQQVRAWGSRGVTRIMLQTFDMDDIDALRLIAAEVLPRVA
jgi:F420-dependent oxidoreductase-like protein